MPVALCKPGPGIAILVSTQDAAPNRLEASMALNIDPWTFPDPEQDLPAGEGPAAVVLAGGCFWCTEAVYSQLDGVTAVVPGYAGDTEDKADYRKVSGGGTNHAEAIRISYDPARISFGQILKMFFSIAHDPTQKDRQGHDVGRHYRSTIFYADEAQRDVAAAYIRQIDRVKIFDARVQTTLEPLTGFYEAEAYHHDYAARNPQQPYIRAVAMPKVQKLRQVHADRLKGADARRAG